MTKPATKDDAQYISLQRAAARLDVSVDYLRDLIASGELPAYRVGKGRGLIRVLIADLDRLLRPIPTVSS